MYFVYRETSMRKIREVDLFTERKLAITSGLKEWVHKYTDH